MGTFNQSRRLKNLQGLKSGAIKLPRHWSKMLGLVNMTKPPIEEFLQVINVSFTVALSIAVVFPCCCVDARSGGCDTSIM